METNLHQKLCCFTGYILIKTSYTIAKRNEMYFAKIKINTLYIKYIF